jgi:hypothetical protein
MDTRKISSGNLRAIGYDERTRTLQVDLSDGSVLQFSAVPPDFYRRFAQASSPWSFYRDNIEESFTVRHVR